jgi:Ca2+-binding RTX toxin-like protein
MTDVAGNATTTAVLETAINPNATIGTYSGQIETVGDHDWIRVTLIAGNTYNIFLSDQEVGSHNGDSEFILRDASGTEVSSNDDNGANLNSFLAFTPTTTGTFYIDVFHHNDNERGAYSLLMTDLNATNVFLSDAGEFVTAAAGERIAGGAGDDTITMAAGAFDALGEQGNDQLDGNTSSNILSGGLGNDLIFGDAGDDFLFGDAGDDSLDGGADNDELFGGDGLDDLFGGTGNDRLSGGANTDFLSGGTGSDIFVFKSLTDSVRGSNRDQVLDFDHGEGDAINLLRIDANLHKHGNQAFHFIGSHSFGHHDGELRLSGHVVQGDVNGDGRADFEISVNVANLQAGDFVL